jgi:hypothetical protein
MSGSKAFFFEKKKQKTFIRLAERSPIDARLQRRDPRVNAAG